ncbi:conserved membrane hypothetical protein [Vibrio harveyi]|uniref:hypothetical protein n=1 Tax=Vibrio harveyi TaxID=669 RepID=UPI0005395B12|nr:hypothetical protein [Vibrio harveyi]AIV06065.1 hypothetical protein LA59_11550 [Vibrio harveyi]MCG9234783.1 hypothetical protein [Vibrio harveyi]MCG9585552.1 hypothetical protein [Vibrio harveyi]CAH1210409.1 conserved membrane hypothetical protein [Vibrio harveyi]CAH1549381.1 conserved membrane hypothetical protein [Vibrio harveyi]
MAYLPFFITPDEFSAYQEEQEQQILKGNNLTVWHKYDIEEPFRYLYLSIAIAAVSPLFVLTYFLHDSSEMILTYILSGLTIIMSGVSYLTFGLDNRYDYTLSDRGLVIKKRRNLPNWVNSATQVMGWIGAIVCVLMVGAAGPVTLVGAGGFILVSFRMLKRQPDEPTDIKIGEREDWLFAYYNKQRKVITLYHKYDDCDYRDVAKTTVNRCHNRGRSFLFFKSTNDLKRVLEKLSEEYQLKCTEFEDIKALFNAYSPDELLSEPARSLEFPLDDTFELRAQNAPIPEWEYLYNGKWQTESEIEKSKSELTTAKE